MDLKELVKEIDYQKSYDYDKRCELFNKYQIPVTLKAFNPILELTTIAKGYTISKNRPSGYSHSGATFSAFNESLKNPNKGIIILQNNYVRITEKIITIYEYNGYDDKIKEIKFKPIVAFDLKDKIIRLIGTDKIWGASVKRTLYQDIDQFLIDLGYSKW